jgi:hypothetical protein
VFCALADAAAIAQAMPPIAKDFSKTLIAMTSKENLLVHKSAGRAKARFATGCKWQQVCQRGRGSGEPA